MLADIYNCIVNIKLNKKLKKIMKKFVFLGLMALALFISCDKNEPKLEEVSEIILFDENVRDYGFHLYYFPYTGEEFAKNLSIFVGMNPELEYVFETGDEAGENGRNNGHFVKFIIKEQFE